MFSLFMLYIVNLFLCLQVETSSALLLSKDGFSAFMMHVFFLNINYIILTSGIRIGVFYNRLCYGEIIFLFLEFPIVFRKSSFVCANVMHGVRIVCCDSCLLYYVVLHALPIKRAFTIASEIKIINSYL